jgi:glutathione synthase/RimK-type ligase-like ATP-grasp enzyme
MKNAARQFVRIIKEYCANNAIEVLSLSHDWIFVLRGKAGNKIIFGYDLGLNPSTVQAAAKDKAAAFQVLQSLGIPAVPHMMFLAPRFLRHIELEGNWQRILACHEANNRRSVVKPNEGTGGLDIFLVQGGDELERAVHEILARERSVAISPYQEISREIRAYVAFDKVPLLYEKRPPFVTGDGTSPVAELVWQKFGADALAGLVQFPQMAARREFLEQVPKPDAQVSLNWKHNLGQGSSLHRLQPSAHADAADLARETARAMGLNFGAVDVVEVNGGLKVLEVNSGVMFENAIRSGDIEYEDAYEIYARALDVLLKT